MCIGKYSISFEDKKHGLLHYGFADSARELTLYLDSLTKAGIVTAHVTTINVEEVSLDAVKEVLIKNANA